MINISELKGMDLSPLPYESMESVGARLAWRNGKPLTHIVRNILKQSRTKGWDGIVPGSPTDIGALAHLCGWGAASLKARCMVETLPANKYEWLHTGFRFCPICLEAAYHSYLFEWDFIQTCPLHGCLLSAVCQTCGVRVQWKPNEDTLAQDGYRCLQCRQYLAGHEPSLADHLLLRQQTKLIESKFRPYGIYAHNLVINISLLFNTWRALETMECDRLRPWCHADLARRTGMHIRTFMGKRAGAARYRGFIHVSWTLKLYSIVPGPANGKDMRIPASQNYQGTYRACLRRLQHWIFGHQRCTEAISAACGRFFAAGDDGGMVGSWPPLVLAYILVRYTMEGENITSTESMQQYQPLRFPHLLEYWRTEQHLQRVALCAYILALFSVTHEIVLRHQDWHVQELFEGTGFPAERLVPIYAPSFPTVRSGDGAAFFPAIEGMPLWPFVRQGYPLVEVPGPDGTECNVFAMSRPRRFRRAPV